MSEGNPIETSRQAEETTPTGSIVQRGTEGGANGQKAEGRTMKKAATQPEPEEHSPAQGRGGESGSLGTKREGREFIKR